MGNYAGQSFEFVTKSELQPVRKELEDIIKKLQETLKSSSNITFTYKLVGSAGRHLVTRVVNGNTGFDFDYNFVIQKDGGLNKMDLRKKFKITLESVLKDTNYSTVSEGRQSMTIKVVDKINKKITHSCDLAIVKEYFDEYDEFYQEILILIKEENRYDWQKRPFGKNYTNKLANLKANGLWQNVKDEYLKLKNNNQDEEKKSFTLYFEAINNLYNRYEWK